MRILVAVLALVAVFAEPLLAEGPQSATTPQIRALADDEFDRYLSALDSVMTLRADAEREFLAAPEKGRDAAVTDALVKQAHDAMQSNGFTTESFNTVHWNVMQAFAQLEIQANAKDVKATIGEQRKELEAAKGKISEEQYTEASKRLEHTEAMLKGFGGVPDENIKLVRSNLTDLKATFKRGMGGVETGYQKRPESSAK